MKDMHRSPSCRRAVTLIELLIVIAIIAILTAAVGTPVTKCIRLARVVDEENRQMAAFSLLDYALTRDLAHGAQVELPAAGDALLRARLPGELVVGYHREGDRIVRRRDGTSQLMIDGLTSAEISAEGRLIRIALQGATSGMGVPPRRVEWAFALEAAPAPPNEEASHE